MTRFGPPLNETQGAPGFFCLSAEDLSMVYGPYFFCMSNFDIWKCDRAIPIVCPYVRKSDLKEYYEEVADWLIYLIDGKLKVRCPQHITDRQLQEIMGRTSENRRRVKEGKERDAKRELVLTTNGLPWPVDMDRWRQSNAVH